MTTTPIKLPAENLRTLHGECCSMFDMAHRLGVELRTFGESEAAQRYAREVVEVFDRMSMAGLRDLAEAAADKPPIPEPIRAYAPVVDEMEELRQDVKTKRKADAARLREGAK